MPSAAPAGTPGRPPTVAWVDGAVELIDQTALPERVTVLRCSTVEAVVDAIRRLAVRGAPAIGVAGAYGVALAAHIDHPVTEPDRFATHVRALREARPTAVNLARMVDRVAAAATGPTAPRSALTAAHEIRDDEVRASRSMGDLGADLLVEWCGDAPLSVMTICNTGALASIERGTALAVIQTLHERGRLREALPLETRPLLQGGRLTTWELARMGAPHRLAVDGAAASILARGLADAVVAGADRVARNGDTANKIGTLSLALAARHAGVPFVIVAPESTVDLATATGADIHIEDRDDAEVVSVGDRPLCPPGTRALNPAFDVTPVDLIDALVTDRRIVRFRNAQTIDHPTPPP